jgi:SsrA-binding protein
VINSVEVPEPRREVAKGESMAKDSNLPIKTLAVNRKARFHFEIEDTVECGIELQGTEVKSMRNGKFSFSDSYGRVRDEQLYLIGFHIAPYEHGNIFNHEPERERRLLVHKQEIKRLRRRVEERGFTLVPLKIYLKGGMIKLELGLGRGKKIHDKRESIKQRDLKRDAERQMREHLR